MFDPTIAPAGRLARLGVVLDASHPADRLLGLASMSERAGIDAIWLADLDGLVGSGGSDGAGLALVPTIGARLERSRLGLLHHPARGSAAVLAALAAGLATPFEVGVLASDGEDAVPFVAELRSAFSSAGSGSRLSGAAGATDEFTALLEVADDVVLPGWRFDDLETAADEVRAEAAEMGRDPGTVGVAALLPVSIGRTDAEARVRADADALFGEIGHPAEIGIYGTLEECQDRVIALAHAGVTDLRCILPSAPDVHDVIAQLTAITIGTTDVLRPGSLRSPAPPPPVGWGGRAERPPQQGVSGGSRRR